MRRYDAILIDADDTLLDFKQAEANALRAMLDRLNMRGEQYERAYRACNHACWQALEKGEITQARLRHKRFEDFLALYGRDEDAAQVGEMYIEDLSRQSILLPGALETVREASRIAPVALVTNGIASVQHGRVDHSAIFPYLSAVVISDELGVAKPNPRMIAEALKRLGGVSPTRAIMVGDSLASDMTCARNAGADACWLNPGDLPAPKDIPIRYMIRDIRELVPLLSE